MADETGTELIREPVREYLDTARRRRGEVLRISPAWARWVFWLLLLLVAAGMLYVMLGTLPEYAEGPAVVWIERIPVTARTSGTVAYIDVKRGQEVGAKFPLLRFHDAQPPHELRYVRAPQRGTVGDIRVRLGQRFSPGDELLSLLPSESKNGKSGLSIIALLPARYLPVLEPNAPLRLEVSGYPYAYQELRIESVGSEAIGPGEVRRYLGQALGDSVLIQEPVVLVRAELPRTFESSGRRHEYHHGMQGTAAVRVRSRSILFTLIPGLEALIGDSNG